MKTKVFELFASLLFMRMPCKSNRGLFRASDWPTGREPRHANCGRLQNTTHSWQIFRWLGYFLWLPCLAAISTASGAGVTVITHGFEISSSHQPIPWLESTADAIATRAGIGTAVYSMNVNTNSPGALLHVASCDFEKGHFPASNGNPNSEVVIKIYWDEVAANIRVDTKAVAAVVLPYLLQNNAAPGLVSPVAELPIHLIGHSRGGSLVCELARLLGQNGVWVDQVTTLDPHPVTTLVADADAVIYENHWCLVCGVKVWRRGAGVGAGLGELRLGDANGCAASG